jgi:branched-chain amino acid transport system permease protein
VSVRSADAVPVDVRVLVTRSERPAAWTALAGVAVVVVLALLPYLVFENVTSVLVNLFIVMTMAVMWNVLAGYAGLVSVGQQAYVGLGAYTVLWCAQHGLEPFVALPIAAAVTAAISLPVSLLVFRLSGGYFAIGTWVIAIMASIVISGIPSLGGGTGLALPGLGGLSGSLLGADTYWAALTVVVVAVVGTYLLLRGRTGLVLTSLRDDPLAARSVGAGVTAAKRLVYLVAAAGCGAAGALVAISQLNVEPGNVFSINWSAYMIFAVLIGGIGSIEGPILGSIVYIVLFQTLGSGGNAVWYLITLGSLAAAMAIWAPRGIWGLATARVRVRIFPVGYWLWTDPGERERHGLLRILLGPVRPAPRRPARDALRS